MGEMEVVGDETESVAWGQEVGELKNQAKKLGFQPLFKGKTSNVF